MREKRKNKSKRRKDPKEVLKLFKELTDEDKILYLIAHIKGHHFNASKEILHKTFYELKKKFPKHFENFYFTETENYPFCKKIDDIFFRFQFYNAINLENPNYERYIISSKNKKIIKQKMKPQFEKENKEFLQDLDDMIKIIRKTLETNESSKI
ncbi:MAG: hypothetical protein ACTSRH_13790 [Promethearchaeota archaeon]